MTKPTLDGWQIAALLLSCQQIIAHDLVPLYDVGEQECAAIQESLTQLLDWPIQEARHDGQLAWANALIARREAILSDNELSDTPYKVIVQLSNLLLVALTESAKRGYSDSAETLARQASQILLNFDEDIAELALETVRRQNKGPSPSN